MHFSGIKSLNDNLFARSSVKLVYLHHLNVYFFEKYDILVICVFLIIV